MIAPRPLITQEAIDAVAPDHGFHDVTAAAETPRQVQCYGEWYARARCLRCFLARLIGQPLPKDVRLEAILPPETPAQP